MRDLVSLDIETTGFDPLADQILEVGAVRFRLDGTVGERFVSLVACDRPIPEVVTRLTGLRAADLEGAPAAEEVLKGLASFVGDAWVVGHNVTFDVGFLESQGFQPVGTRLDTVELATFLLPRAPSYSLQRLAASLRGDARAHRALDDAEAAALLCISLFREAATLSIPTLEGLIQLSEPLGEGIRWFLGEVLVEKARTAFQEPAPHGAAEGPRPVGSRPEDGGTRPGREGFGGAGGRDRLAAQGGTGGREALAAHGGVALDASLPELFSAGGVLASAFAEFEERAEQLEMAEAVERTLVEGGALLVEAGTGTGKSLAYLVSALRAARRGKRVLIATYTTTLQDQLATADLPRLVETLGLDLSAAVLKGRSNYLCPRRWHLFRLSAASPEEARFAMKTLVWRERTVTGDRAELSLLGGGEQALWSRMSAEDETCTSRRCGLVRGGCFLERARTAAADAPLVIANHALLLSDARARNRLLPDVDIVVVDEAHHLDEVAARIFGVRLMAVDVRRAVQRTAQAGAALSNEVDRVRVMRDEAQRTLTALEETFLALSRLMYDAAARGYEDQRRITEAVRASDEWLAVELATERLRDALAGLLRSAEPLLALSRGADEPESAAELEGALGEVRAVDAALGRVVHAPPAGEICWLSLDSGGALALQSAPAHAGAQIDRAVTRGRHAAVFTSATLAVAGSFSFATDRFGLGDRADTLRVGSGFDYRKQALLVLPSGLVDPFDPGFVEQIASFTADVSTRLGGRTLVLFTSHAMLRAAHGRLAPLLEESGIAVLAQSMGGSRRQLLEQFAAGSSVLLGTATFWEGIDLPGELLRCVAIAKLPFPVPDDPIVAGRSERYDDPFREYHLPVAALRLRQGFGRLIRTRQDRGAVVLLDRRLGARAYGETFLRSLPDCTIVRPALAEAAPLVAAWSTGSDFATDGGGHTSEY